MTNTTEIFWDVDGVSLQTYAFNITTLGGDRQAPPPVRGDDITVPYAPGQKWVPKVPDSRTMTLGMWVIGADEDGLIPADAEVRRLYERNWAKLRKLLWTPRRQFTLTKRFWVLEEDLVAGGVDVDDLPRSGDYRLLSASARGSYAGGLVPTMAGGPARATFTVDIKLADPYFYSDEIEIAFSMTSGSSLPGPTRDVTVLGDDRTHQIEVDLTGPLGSPRLSNLSDEEIDLWMRYATSVDASTSATVRVRPFSATHFPGGAPYKSSGYVQHDGDKFWFYLDPGEATLALTAASGTGTAKLRYRPAWL